MQIISDDAVFNIPLELLEYRENPICINSGNCVFSENGIKLNIRKEELSVSGELRFGKLSSLKYDSLKNVYNVFTDEKCQSRKF